MKIKGNKVLETFLGSLGPSVKTKGANPLQITGWKSWPQGVWTCFIYEHTFHEMHISDLDIYLVLSPSLEF